MTDAFWFPAEEVKLIYDKYHIIECYVYLNLTDADSCSCFISFSTCSKTGSGEI